MREGLRVTKLTPQEFDNEIMMFEKRAEEWIDKEFMKKYKDSKHSLLPREPERVYIDPSTQMIFEGWLARAIIAKEEDLA